MIEIDNIYNMDCLEGMKQIPDGSVDAIICDLPYGTTACKWDVVIPFELLWENFSQVEFAWTSFDGPAKLYRYDNRTGDKIHPTQKPIDLYAYCLQWFAKEGDRIFDPMMGSQSSRIAAYKMGYDYVGCEIDKDFFAKGCERFDRECRGITIGKNGQRYHQTSMFDNNQV